MIILKAFSLNSAGPPLDSIVFEAVIYVKGAEAKDNGLLCPLSVIATHLRRHMEVAVQVCILTRIPCLFMLCMMIAVLPGIAGQKSIGLWDYERNTSMVFFVTDDWEIKARGELPGDYTDWQLAMALGSWTISVYDTGSQLKVPVVYQHNGAGSWNCSPGDWGLVDSSGRRFEADPSLSDGPETIYAKNSTVAQVGFTLPYEPARFCLPEGEAEDPPHLVYEASAVHDLHAHVILNVPDSDGVCDEGRLGVDEYPLLLVLFFLLLMASSKRGERVLGMSDSWYSCLPRA
jgi:hypothetical protein